jgi:large repetitive protein
VFEPGTTEIRAQWRPRMDLLMKELQKGPAILRLSYLADVENEQIVQRRMETIKAEIATRWHALNAGYELSIEQEVFWRLGAPPQQAQQVDSSR